MTGTRAGGGQKANPVVPLLAYQADPIREGVQRLGRRWTLLLVRDMAFLKLSRFGEFLRNNPGLTPRVLSRRLTELQAEQLIVRREGAAGVRYRLTPRGEDAVFILLAFLRYGSLHYASPRSTPPSRGSLPFPNQPPARPQGRPGRMRGHPSPGP